LSIEIINNLFLDNHEINWGGAEGSFIAKGQ